MTLKRLKKNHEFEHPSECEPNDAGFLNLASGAKSACAVFTQVWLDPIQIQVDLAGNYFTEHLLGSGQRFVVLTAIRQVGTERPQKGLIHFWSV